MMRDAVHLAEMDDRGQRVLVIQPFLLFDSGRKGTFCRGTISLIKKWKNLVKTCEGLLWEGDIKMQIRLFSYTNIFRGRAVMEAEIIH